jgi:DNA helicase II / ATP-dependent DNA helicase PcrA
MHTDVATDMIDSANNTGSDARGGRDPRRGVPGEEEILSGLTGPQQEAVRCTEGPLLVLAGPGSGKTRVITRRIAYLIACGIPAWQILAVTFTNKAAAEMRERVVKMLGEGAGSRGLTVTTFHALCARLIRKYADIAKLPGITGTFAIYDTDDQTTLVKRAIEQAGVTTSNWPARSVLSKISAAKNDLLGPDEYATQAFDFNGRTIAKIYAFYQKALRAANAVDFDDLLLLTAQMLKNNAQVREQCRERWQYLLVDEYQDTNTAQFQIAALLAGAGDVGAPALRAGAGMPDPNAPGSESRGTRNICVVGDPDQSIYGWRGADIENILQFEKHFPKARTIALGENFRSTKHIIAAADTLIRNNKKRKHKDLFTSNADGARPEVVICRDEHHEARLVVDWMKERREESMAEGEPLAWKDFAVFYRTNALSRVVEDVLRNEAIPYVIARGTAFYQREEIKHALAYLRVVANPADEVSLLRIVNTPSRGIGDTTMSRVEMLASERGAGVLDALRVAPEALQLASRTGSSISKFVKMVDEWAGIHEEGMLHAPAAEGSLAELVERVIRESGLEDMYKKMGEDEAERLENLAELVSSAREYEETYDPASDPGADPMTAPLNPDEQPEREPSLLELLRGYLERVTLVADADSVDPTQGSVTLMTLHAAKGLEFAGVAMVGLEEGLLPHSRVMEHPGELEEERRLCFVGITRAMRRLLITSARYRTIRGVTERTIESRFIHELPKEHVTISDQAGFSEPGWDTPSARLGEGRGDGPRFVPDGPTGGKTKVSGPKDSRGLPLVVGAQVRHPQFGLGRIVGLTSGQDARAQIEFRQAGRKTLVLQYARLERVE